MLDQDRVQTPKMTEADLPETLIVLTKETVASDGKVKIRFK